MLIEKSAAAKLIKFIEQKEIEWDLEKYPILAIPKKYHFAYH